MDSSSDAPKNVGRSAALNLVGGVGERGEAAALIKISGNDGIQNEPRRIGVYCVSEWPLCCIREQDRTTVARENTFAHLKS